MPLSFVESTANTTAVEVTFGAAARPLAGERALAVPVASSAILQGPGLLYRLRRLSVESQGSEHLLGIADGDDHVDRLS